MPRLLSLASRLRPIPPRQLARAQSLSTSARANTVLGLRAEDVQRVWERRAPLSPRHVKELIERDGVEVVVQRSEKRVWRDDEYRQVSFFL